MESIWRKTCEIEKRPSLREDIKTEAAIIGGGMAGILAAYQLQKAGISVVVLEAGEIAGGQTQNTTAKITSQHGMICHTFLKQKGEETARKYMQANQEAIREYEKIIEEENITCDFEQTDSYVYSGEEEKLQEEVKAAKVLGINADFVKDIEIPLSCAGGIRFPKQAQFHPLKFIKGISAKLKIYENTMVKEVKDHQLITEEGNVKAEKIIFASHYPFINFPGMYFTRMHQERSYVLALEHAGRLKGMYIGDEPYSYSFRQYGDYVLLGGRGHRTGENKGGRFDNLRIAAELFFPESREVTCWSAQDCMTSDQIPFIGTYASSRPDWLVSTGFQKWGMTSSMVSAMLLKDQICGIQNPYSEVFSSLRFSAEEIPQIMKEGKKAVKGLAKRMLQIPEGTAKMLHTGQGKIMEIKGEKTGVYKSEEDEIFMVDVKCPHMGCQLEWNQDERTWDCPCHGSRFDYQGRLKEGPAQEGI
nr:FAD-dependent oxidoreductase [uncultured Sellimonas sp.]